MRGPALPDALLAAVPELADAVWSRLPGLSGGVWCALPPQGPALVVRPADPWETEATVQAAAGQVAPPVRAAAAGWLVTERLAASQVSTLELSRPTVLAEVAALLHRWHTAAEGSTGAPEQTLRAARAAYLEPARAGCPEVMQALEALLAEADRREAALLAAPTGAVIGHLDVAANLLRTQQGLVLIDFEYAARVDPNRELGQLAWEGELGPDSVRRLADAYWHAQGAAGAHQVAAVATWAWLAGVTWTLWGAAQLGGTQPGGTQPGGTQPGGTQPPPAEWGARWTRRSLERLRSYRV